MSNMYTMVYKEYIAIIEAEKHIRHLSIKLIVVGYHIQTLFFLRWGGSLGKRSNPCDSRSHPKGSQVRILQLPPHQKFIIMPKN